MSRRIAQRSFQCIVFQHIAINTNFNLPSGTQVSQGAKHCCEIPAIRLALELFDQSLKGSPDPATIIALQEGKHFLFGLGKRCAIVAEQAFLSMLEEFSNIILGVIEAAQHPQIRISTLDQVMKTFSNTCLRIL